MVFKFPVTSIFALPAISHHNESKYVISPVLPVPAAGSKYQLAAAAQLGIASLFPSNKEEVAANSLSPPVFPLIIPESYFLFKFLFKACSTWEKKNHFNYV